jgi:hypothetical protein
VPSLILYWVDVLRYIPIGFMVVAAVCVFVKRFFLLG